MPPATSSGVPQRPIGVRARIGAALLGVLGRACGQRRRDPARRDGVDADALAGPGGGEALRQLGDAALRGAVGGHARAAEESQHRGHVDDGAAARDELSLRCRADPHRAGEVDRDHLGEHLGIMLDVAADHAGRVHHHVEPRQTLDERSYCGVLAHVEAAKRDAAIRGVGLGPLALRIGRAGRENGSTEVAEGERGAEPDAARAAGDEHAAAGKEAGREAINDAGHRSGLERDGDLSLGPSSPFLILRCERTRASKDATLPVQRPTALACFEARPSASHLSMRRFDAPR